jgi:N-acetylglucosaminyldiphosphoundecaprenol N-acetyl-beta-D-mannosaminyltransferase
MSRENRQLQTVLGIKFLMGGYSAAKRLLDNGALMVVPSAPVLERTRQDPLLHAVLKSSDFALPDSGLMVTVLKYMKGIRLDKLSGLTFLRLFMEEEILKQERSLFLVDPDEEEMRINHRLLRSQGIKIEYSDHYVAPIYSAGQVEDGYLLQTLGKKRPKYVLINLGGGIQERLGLYLKEKLSYNPGIICTGAAIAFLTGKQASIPPIFDTLHLGWLLRCLHDPKRFIPRYLKGLRLIPLILKEVK